MRMPQRYPEEDGYPYLWVDGQLLKAFDFKDLSYELQMLGQHPGKHTAIVKLMELPPGEEDESSPNTELYIAKVKMPCPLWLHRLPLCI